MTHIPDPLIRQLQVDRLARLHAWLCLREYTVELSFVVATRNRANVPSFYLEALNLVLAPSEELGGGRATPSACLPGGSIPAVEYDPGSNELAAEFELNLDIPAARQQRYEKLDPEDDTPGPTAVTTRASLRGRFLSELRPREYGFQNLECELRIDVPDEFVEKLNIAPSLELSLLLPFIWFYLVPQKELWVQPVFISPDGATPPTGSDFYPLLARANEIWAKCCVRFRAKCPRYVDKQEYRISTQAEATAFKDEVDVADAIEVFMVERLDPETLWGGGATFASGTATAKIVTGDNQLPGNDNHLAHELGHVLGLDHPNNPGGLIDGCVGSVMEPSGFFADNPEFQCRFNCRTASNPLLNFVLYRYCIARARPDDELF